MKLPLKHQPAFPLVLDSTGTLTADSPGLTKLEYFAGLAMQSFIEAGIHNPACGLDVHHTGDAALHLHARSEIARLSVEMAVALLAELEKEKE